MRYCFYLYYFPFEFGPLGVETGKMKSVPFRVAETLRESENIVFLSKPEIMLDRYFEAF